MDRWVYDISYANLSDEALLTELLKHLSPRADLGATDFKGQSKTILAKYRTWRALIDAGGGRIAAECGISLVSAEAFDLLPEVFRRYGLEA